MRRKSDWQVRNSIRYFLWQVVAISQTILHDFVSDAFDNLRRCSANAYKSRAFKQNEMEAAAGLEPAKLL